MAAKIAERLSVTPGWMKLAQAVKYSNIGKERLINLAKIKRINGFKDIDLKTEPWIFEKKSIDQYRSEQSITDPQTDAEEFALDLYKKIGL